ncbi:MAG TPA: bifunctional (p)ppGpp synthetase/guanosine-3',5'-bis(diphosphate) 3'-pyrophosphohydrolase [Steroidobacteraceae bacterium]|nr:bifunctional (p)ppGpp synthetase/guanosine-3',5'-bis(diphosphate) 3'-pyrophosphohydrolase [Steroidobacteraceae bacterium]
MGRYDTATRDRHCGFGPIAMETTSPVRLESSRLDAAFAAVRALEIERTAEPRRASALEVAQIVRGLEADEDVVLAALLQPLIEARLIERERAVTLFGTEAARLARELIPLGQFGLPADWTPERELEAAQAEALRKMLLALIGDVRLVVVRLAAQLERMRAAKSAAPEVKRKLAIETREVYAPLANRLGVWQVKWELEDLAFRYLQPEDYRRIAAALKARRKDRERYIEDLKSALQRALVQTGVEATVQGRPKHIFSIWRKMQTKQLDFEQLMDIRAIRVLVDTVSECYAALGVVHSLWPFIPGEFDDYIATPKGNLYRSIHTAVIGPEKLPVEVQIRTHEMHANSEHGVAAHWRYKEGGRSEKAYERKINELRALLAPSEGNDPPRDFLDRMRVDLFQDRVYVLSPKGEIVDVPVGGTPLDFAYQVHTDLGHRTRGAKVNGRMVALDYVLKNGESVEIITAKTPQPSRDWLATQSGFLASPRNRNKVRAWFRKLDATRNESAGKELLERELQRLGLQQLPMPELLAELRLDSVDALHEALGLGEVSVAQLLGALQRVLHARETQSPAEPARPVRAVTPTEAQVEVQGIGDLLSTFARCCRPVPPEPIAGFITVGRGVSIHARACANLARLAARSPARVLAVDWGERPGALFPVDIEVRAFDRRGLVRDVSAALADEKISIQAMHTVTDAHDQVAHLQISISISGLPQLSRVLARIAQVPNVIGARRHK